ncbi:enoyl-CoA hydratase-related protein [Corynebacterium pygosceleis]|uniref:Probable enoyl-CoA hydratase echA8 n=1 Tax=Corynebacterium pygosceleis TaxID=2800406 RepID=A0A9Q4C6H5_9CORY|nr:enoyl-CoA hydratase-related protein [Corynebacterium pygosceleis]MCK7636814.1 enoyl-CoA hydratase-related protein [Corynebacterium pygosceleis]MCK7674288.1 enoyl-CoA hydratase-related protein [Corynebacterium pygosceleis]MCL0120414.1 enoyl-CoA hydratase-related protein [Corynebacterium pygosceleis]MCX7443960.1 enoyl-CoA hydratase-related protein [Corynebacterium pygosceleis]MCX7467567.1 enoyl-CoA hydratase-related protein [Corynebacterium pygosceleis]
MTTYNTLTIERDGRVAVITINRPEVLNALDSETMHEVVSAGTELDRDDGIGCIVLTGAGGKAFAAGADIGEMASKSATDMYSLDFFARWEDFTRLRTPVIAAVDGYALGGGCELAMMCDLIIAGEKARFGQPEINLGVIPGMGGSQRLTRAIGKAKAMEMCLTGRMMEADEAESAGLVARVVPAGEALTEAMETARVIASKSKIAATMVKEVINAAYENTLEQGVRYERRMFHSVFASEDQTTGMTAFMNKENPEFRHR